MYRYIRKFKKLSFRYKCFKVHLIIIADTMKHCLDTCYNVFHSFKVWHWSDSPENQFSPLNTGSGIQNCALMFQSNGMFKQDSCILHYPYVCEVQSGTFGVFFCLKLFYNAKNNCRCNFTFLFYIILIDASCIVWLYVFFSESSVLSYLDNKTLGMKKDYTLKMSSKH